MVVSVQGLMGWLVCAKERSQALQRRVQRVAEAGAVAIEYQDSIEGLSPLAQSSRPVTERANTVRVSVHASCENVAAWTRDEACPVDPRVRRRLR